MSINSRVRKWWLLRLLLVVLVFGGFGGWCVYDGVVKYPRLEDNFQKVYSQVIEKHDKKKLEAIFKEVDVKRIEQKIDTGQFAIVLDDDEENYKQLKFVNVQTGKKYKIHSDRDAGDKEYYVKSDWDILTQFLMAAVSIAIALAVFLRVLLVLRKKIYADEEGVQVNNRRITYDAITKLDKRKWNRKSIATLYYNSDGNSGRFQLDDWIFEGHREILAEAERRMRPEAAVLEPPQPDTEEGDEEENGENSNEKH